MPGLGGRGVLAKPAVGAAALTPSVLTSGSDDVDTTGGFLTAAVALTAGRLYTLGFVTRRDSGAQGSLTASQTGATWTQVASTSYNSDNTRLTVFRCQPSGAVASSQITVENPDPITSDWGQWILVEWDGVFDDSAGNGAGAVVQSGTNSTSGDSPNVNLPSPLASASNAGLVFGVHSNTSSLVARSPGSQLGSVNVGAVYLAGVWGLNLRQPILDATTPALNCAVGLEIKDG